MSVDEKKEKGEPKRRKESHTKQTSPKTTLDRKEPLGMDIERLNH